MTLAASPVSGLICTALTLFWFLLLGRVIVDLVMAFGGMRRPVVGPGRTAIDLLYGVTEPVMAPFRKLIPPVGMFDLSVLVLFVVLGILQRVFC